MSTPRLQTAGRVLIDHIMNTIGISKTGQNNDSSLSECKLLFHLSRLGETYERRKRPRTIAVEYEPGT